LSNTGTILFLFRHPTNTPPTNTGGYSPMWNCGRSGNPGQMFGLQSVAANGLAFRTLNNTSDLAANRFVRTYDSTDWDNASGFHLAALVKANDADPPTLFVDGGQITSFSDVEGGSSDRGMWFADVTTSQRLAIKAAQFDSNVGWDGSIDEMVMFLSQELTQAVIQELTESLGLSIRGDG